MAVFNPAVSPTQDPNYLNYSRVIEAPPPDMSGKIGLETAASTLDSAVTVTDQAIKKGIETAAYKAVDPLRDQFTQGLEKVKSDLNNGVIPKPAQAVSGTTTGKSWLDSNAMGPDPEELPVGLQDGLDGVTAMAYAKSQGSPKLNDTKYAGDVLAEAKRLRNQYGPGYREYIDQKISEASGLPVANSYYNNMLLDINRQMMQMSKVKDDVGKAMEKGVWEGVPGMAGLIAKRKAGDPAITDSFVWSRINDYTSFKAQQTIDAAKRAENSDNKKVNSEDQDARLTRTLNTSVQMEMSALKDVSLPGIGSAKDLLTYFDDVSAGRITQSDAEIGQKKMMFNNWVKNVETRLYAQSTGYADVVGADVAEKRVKAAMAPIYTQQKFINSKEDGPAFFHAQQIEAIKNDATHNFLNNKDTQALSTQLLGARAVLGEQYFPDFIRSVLINGQDKKFKDLFSEEAMSAIQPITDTRGQPIPRYMKDAIKKGKEVGATGDSGYYGGITDLVGKVADKGMNLAAKDQLIDWAFNPKNVGRLDELKMDYRDPQTGNWVDGKYRMFNLLSSPAITQGVKETALVHPDNYVKYQRTLEIEFGSLYRSDISELNKQMVEDFNLMGVGKTKLHFSYNDKTNEYGLVDKNNRPVIYNERVVGAQYPDEVRKNGILDTLEKVNGGLRNLANIYRNNPQGEIDPSQKLLQALQTIGLRPGENINGATEGMTKAVIKAKNPDMTPEDLNKKILGSGGPMMRSNFTPEEDRTLAAFLRSPAGQATGQEPQQTRGVMRGNLSDEKLLGIQTDEIPEGMSAREFIQMLKSGKKLGGSVR